MSLVDITQKILADAKDSSDLLLTEATATAQDIHADGEKKQQLLLNNLDAQAEEKIQSMFHKVKNLLLSEQKSSLLTLKRSLLTEMFGKAADALSSLSESEKTVLFAFFLSQIPVTEGMIYPVAKDRSLLDSLLKKEKTSFSLGEDTEGLSGFTFVSDSIEMDFRCDVLLRDDIVQNAEQEASQMLFSA